MHTISAEELLKAYNGKYKYVTMDSNKGIAVWASKPTYADGDWTGFGLQYYLEKIAITEFQDRTADLCIYKAKPLEEDWVGKSCWFGDEDEDLEKAGYRLLDVLGKIETVNGIPRYCPDNVRDSLYRCCRPVRPDEIKFFNDDTSEE